MTTVTFIHDQGKLIGFTISGHSGYAEHGKDIVCAGISGISQSIMNGILNVAKVKCIIDIESTIYSVALLDLLVIDEDMRKQDDARLLMYTMKAAMDNLAGQYPVNVAVSHQFVEASKFAKAWEMRYVKE